MLKIGYGYGLQTFKNGLEIEIIHYNLWIEINFAANLHC